MGEVETLPPIPTMPHPLPDDVNSVTGLKWFLAAVPDDPAFTRAAWDIFTEMGNYWKWGKEGPVPGDSDKAAQLWTNAIYETIEAYKMGFPDVLLGYVDDVETLLTAIRDRECCPGGTGDTVTDITTDGDGFPLPPGDEGEDFEVGVGDAPGGTDWGTTYPPELCANAQAFVASLTTWVNGIATARALISAGVTGLLGAAVGLVAAQLVAVGVVSAAVGSVIGSGVGLLSRLATLNDIFGSTTETTDDLARAELADSDVIDQLVCAIIGATTTAEAETAMDGALLEHAPNAHGYLAALPMRWFMRSAMELEMDGSGFSGCPECEATPGTIEGYSLSFTNFDVSDTTGNTNIVCRDVPGPTSDYLRTGGNDLLHINESLFAISNPFVSAIGLSAALDDIVANREQTLTAVQTLDTVARIKLVIVNGSSGTRPLIECALGSPQLYDGDTDTWRNANLTLVSSDAGWSQDGNALSFSAENMGAGATREAIVDLAYSS